MNAICASTDVENFVTSVKWNSFQAGHLLGYARARMSFMDALQAGHKCEIVLTD